MTFLTSNVITQIILIRQLLGIEYRLYHGIIDIQFSILGFVVKTFVCTYNSNIYSLYSKLKGYDVFENVTASGNTVTILNDILQENGDDTLVDILEVNVSERNESVGKAHDPIML